VVNNNSLKVMHIQSKEKMQLLFFFKKKMQLSLHWKS